MPTTEKLRSDLIDKILSINDKEILAAIDKLLESAITSDNKVKISKEQRIVIEASFKDIKKNRLIDDEQLNKEEDEWLAK
jgi:hypothetical protein